MEKYLHRIVGLYPTPASVESAQSAALSCGIPRQQIQILAPGSEMTAGNDKSDSDDVLKDLLRDGAIGTMVGAAAGAGVTVALVAANITLFVANPVFGALYLLGWGASLGGVAGAMIGSERSKGDMSHLIRDALDSGQYVMLVQTLTEAQTSQARQVINVPMNNADASLTPEEQQARAAVAS